MTFEEIVVLMGLAGLLLAGGASRFRIPPLAVLAAACVPTALVVTLAMRETDTPCGSPGMGRAAALLFAPQTPLLFMGEEYGEQRPFQFFTDHPDPEIAEATREGRKREFEQFSAFSGEDVPDPQDPATFERSKLRPDAGDPDLRACYQRLLRLRRTLPRTLAVAADEEQRLLRVRRGDLALLLNFSSEEQSGVRPRDAEIGPD